MFRVFLLEFFQPQNTTAAIKNAKFIFKLIFGSRPCCVSWLPGKKNEAPPNTRDYTVPRNCLDRADLVVFFSVKESSQRCETSYNVRQA